MTPTEIAYRKRNSSDSKDGVHMDWFSRYFKSSILVKGRRFLVL